MLSKIKSFIFDNNRLVIHLFVWSCITIGYWMLMRPYWIEYDPLYKTIFTSAYLLFPAIFYLNVNYIIPYMNQRRKAFIYGILLLLTLFILELNKNAIFDTLKYLLQSDFNFVKFTNEFLNGPIAFGILTSLGYSFVKYLNEYPGLLKQLRADNTEMELAFLKSQVNPHFLFNTLNALYALALEEDSPKTADGIARLGTLMRYNLHDSQAAQIPLEKEIDYIEKYIELQRLRTTRHTDIEFVRELSGAATADSEVKIAPMLLIPFVENAFKFGISPSEASVVRIEMRLKKNKFQMVVKNSIMKQAPAPENSGVGLQNVRKRLRLLYPDQHELVCEQRGNSYCVELKLRLS